MLPIQKQIFNLNLQKMTNQYVLTTQGQSAISRLLKDHNTGKTSIQASLNTGYFLRIALKHKMRKQYY